MQPFHPTILVYVVALLSQSIALGIPTQPFLDWSQHSTQSTSHHIYNPERRYLDQTRNPSLATRDTKKLGIFKVPRFTPDFSAMARDGIFAKLLYQRDNKEKKTEATTDPICIYQRYCALMATKRRSFMNNKLDAPTLLIQRSPIDSSPPKNKSNPLNPPRLDATGGLSMFQTIMLAFGALTLVMMFLGLFFQVLQIRRQRRQRSFFSLCI